MDTLIIKYIHNCPSGCDNQGREYLHTPFCDAGVALVVVPVCIKTGAQLREVGRWVNGEFTATFAQT